MEKKMAEEDEMATQTPVHRPRPLQRENTWVLDEAHDRAEQDRELMTCSAKQTRSEGSSAESDSEFQQTTGGESKAQS
jgi:hypothetical protein